MGLEHCHRGNIYIIDLSALIAIEMRPIRHLLWFGSLTKDRAFVTVSTKSAGNLCTLMYNSTRI